MERFKGYIFLRMIFRRLLNCIGNSPVTWLGCVTVFLSFFLFNSFWITWINKIWVDPIASQIKGNTWWVVIIYSLIASAYYYHSSQKTEVISKNRCKVVIVGTLLYCICLFSGVWDYVLIFDCCRYLAWSNFIIIVPILWESYIWYQLNHKKVAENIKPKLEIEKTSNVTDSYKRQAVCESAYKTLKSCFYKEGSFTFSVTGIWGSGKTTFINNLKEQYNRDSSAQSVIVFEPWKSDTSDSIVKGFFAMLRDELSSYIPNISSTIDQYVELLLDEESGKPLKIIGKSLHGIFNKDNNPYELIKELLEQTKHKTVVFVDDIDRLNAVEIKEVLRLIRNTANFPYIQFIVAYDKNYVCETLTNNGINTPDRYLEKFFNVEMVLPKSEERVICNELLARIQGTITAIWELKEDDSIMIAKMVYYRPEDPTNSIIDNNLVPKILYTIRDVIRFHNSFCLLAKAYKDQNAEKEVCFQDLFFLELLRYRYLEIYNLLCNKPFALLLLNGNIFSLNERSKSIIKEILVNNEHTEIVTDILEFLFENKGREYAVYNLRSYYKYFMYRLDDKILTVNEVLLLAEKTDSEIVQSANQLYENKYRFEFENQIEELLTQIYIPDENGKRLDYSKIYNLLERLSKPDIIRGLKNEIFNVIISHLRPLNCIDSKHLKAFLHLYDVVESNSINIHSFDTLTFLMSILFKSALKMGIRCGNEKEVCGIVYDFLSNTTHPTLISPALSIFKSQIEESDNIKKNNLLIDLSTLSNIQLKYFENVQDKFSDDGFILFDICISKIDIERQYRINIRQKALNIMKEAILKNPEGYFRKFLKCDVDPSFPSYSIVSPGYYDSQIFGSDKGFEEFLKECKRDNPYVIRVQNYWELYKNNGYKPIKFKGQGSVQEIINNNFENEIKMLNQLKRIMQEVNSIAPISDDLLTLLQDNKLDIKLRADIYKIIENKLPHKF